MAVVLHIKSYMAVCKNQKTEAEFRVFILIVILWQVQDLLNSDRFYFLGLQNHCGWGLQPWKAMTNLDSVLKTRAITWLTKVCIVKAVVFPVVMYECESWTIKKSECQRIDAFELRCCRRFVRVPWTARSNQSILKEISPEYSLERLVLKLKLQYFGHPMQRADSLEKTLMLGKTEGRRRRGRQRMRWLDGHEFEQALGVGDGQGGLVCCSPWGHKELDTTERLNDNKEPVPVWLSVSSAHCVRTNSYRSQLLKVTVGPRLKILTFSSDSQSTRAARVLKGLKPHAHHVLQP